MRLSCYLAFVLLLGPLLTPAHAQSFDLLIQGGQVYDGTGNPWFYADLGIRDGRIIAMGTLDDATATRTIDATGLAILPGFIDLHSHADDGARRMSSLRHEDKRMRAAPNLVMQGVTTVVVNQDGRSPWPIAAQKAQIEELGIGVNAVLLAGHGTLRQQVMGSDVQRAATPDEVDQMRTLMRQAMDEGAWGLSAGLEYAPGRWSTTEEVAAIVGELVPYDGFYISHQRSEGADPMWYWPSQDTLGVPTLMDAVLETIAIGEQSGAKVVASHLKAKGAHYWGTSHTVIQLINAARDRGVAIWGDQYPYTTSGTDGNTVLLPRWIFRQYEAPDFAQALDRALAQPDTAAMIRRDVAHEIRRRGSADKIVVLNHPDTTLIGESLQAMADARGIDAVEMAFVLQREGNVDRPGGAHLRGFSMSEIDVEAYAREPWMATISDGGIALQGGPPVHPRFYGTFPRKLHRYAMERGVISLEHAIRSATSLPAQIIGLPNRGLVRTGYHADLVLVDLAQLRDRADTFDPHQYPEGIVHVFLGGQPIVEDGQANGALIGRVLTR